METLWTTEELATFLSKKPQWIRENIHSLRIPGMKLGNHWRFAPDEIYAWLKTQ